MPLVKPTEKENLNFIRIGGVASRARGAVFKSAGADPPLLKRSQWGGLSYRKQIFEIWSGSEQLPFKFETTKKVESSGLVR